VRVTRLGSGGDGLGTQAELGEQLLDDADAATAPRTGAAAVGQGIGIEGPGGDLVSDRNVVHCLAVAHHHGGKSA